MAGRLIYRDQSRIYLEKARQHLEEEDFLQASEKGWGAASQIVKALAQARGWEHNGHRELFFAVSDLVEETGDTELTDLFGVANTLHGNFYEGWLPHDEVRRYVQLVTRFVGKVEALLDGG